MIHQIACFETHGKEVRKLEIGTHSGTHIDAPRHFIEGGATVDQIPLDTLCGPALMLDLTECVGAVSAAQLAYSALQCGHRGRLPGRVVLRYDGHRRLHPMEDYYFKQPWLAEGAAHWLVDNGCELVAMDTPMPDGPDNIKEMPIHKILLGAGVVIAEYLVNLDTINASRFDLTVAPLYVKGGDGAPARCFAIVND